jgi:hypothetical protein
MVPPSSTAFAAAIETQARLTGATYRLQPRDTVQLTSNATESAWSAAAIGAAHNTPTVIAAKEASTSSGMYSDVPNACVSLLY